MANPAPEENPLLLGHADAEQHLLDAWSSGKLAHGWLFTGPKGVGKMTLACRFARFLLANPSPADSGDAALLDLQPPPSPTSLEIPDSHPMFKRVAGRSHADLHFVERQYRKEDLGREVAGRRRRPVISVEDVREAGRSMNLTASEGGWRVVIVDGADEMNTNASNALLKLLEEPPARSVLMLVVHAKGTLPATIMSRCCQLRLSPLSDGIVSGLMETYRPELNDDERRQLTGLSDGSIGRALALADSQGLAVHDGLMDLLATLPELDMRVAHEFSKQFARRENETAWDTVTDLTTRCLNRMVSAGARGTDLTAAGFGHQDAERLTRLRQLAGLDRWLDVWDKTTELFATTNALHLDRRQVMLNVLGIIQTATRSGGV